MNKRWLTGGTLALNWWYLPALDMHKGVFFFIFKVAVELRRANAEACVLCRGGGEGGGVQILFLRCSQAETQMSGNKNSPEKRGQFLLISRLCTMKRTS